MKIISTPLKGVSIIEPIFFEDSRGYFMETYQKKRYKEAGIDCNFVQDNLSFSNRATIRGLHFQLQNPQAKLVQVIKGAIFDVAVDIRVGSPDFGRWTGVELTDENKRQLFIPEGFAHGFLVLSESVYFIYKCSDYYAKDDEGGILWSDPGIGIKWNVDTPILSGKDSCYKLLKDIPAELLPRYYQPSHK